MDHIPVRCLSLCPSFYLSVTVRPACGRREGRLVSQTRSETAGAKRGEAAVRTDRESEGSSTRQNSTGAFYSPSTMVKCLIRIKTKVNVHLRMINHCYRDVKVRVLSLGPRLLGKALGVLPLFPALPGGASTSGSAAGVGQSSRSPDRLAVPPQLHGCSPPHSHAGKTQDCEAVECFQLLERILDLKSNLTSLCLKSNVECYITCTVRICCYQSFNSSIVTIKFPESLRVVTVILKA